MTANQNVPDDLMELAMKSSWFRKSRFKSGKGKTMANIGGLGLGFRERPPPNKAITSFSGASSSSASCSSTSAPPPKGTNRLSALKEAFKSQYNTQFRSSSDTSWQQTLPPEGVFAKPEPSKLYSESEESAESKKSKKSRWN